MLFRSTAPRLLLFILLSALALGCDDFDSPPQMTIVGIEEGFLSDPAAPLVLRFHEPIDFTTLRLKVIRYEVDGEGRLADEVPGAPGELNTLFEASPDDSDLGGVAELNDAKDTYTITLSQTFPIGPQLAVLIEPGLKDEAGNEWKVRQIHKFGFEFSCQGDEATAPSAFPTGFYFFQVEVDKPISTQILLWADIRVDAETGDFVGQFTNADRDPAIDCSNHGLQCAETEVCRTLPTPACVVPSEKAGTPDEYPDFYANDVLPTGYSFTVPGCVRDRADGTFSFANAPVDVVVISPPVKVKGINLNSLWGDDSEGVLRGNGVFQAAQVFLGDSPSGVGVGTHLERQVPADEVPNIPAPPASATAD